MPPTSTPIFVVGMPRTGTTLLERILGNHPQIETCGELNDFRQQMQWANNQRLTLTLDVDIGDIRRAAGRERAGPTAISRRPSG